MERAFARLLVVVALAALPHVALNAVATQKVVHAATSGTPMIVAVLADHYTDEAEFDNDVANFITFGLLTHPYYAGRAADLQIVSFYDPVDAGSASDYGFDVEVPSQNCVMSWSDDPGPNGTLAKITAVVGNLNPEHTIVIGDHPYNIGCTEGEWTYVGVDASSSNVLAHELGHGFGVLLDEWVRGDRLTVSHPGILLQDTRNCYDTRHGATPPWTQPGAGSVPGCDLYGLDVVHAFPAMHQGHRYCLMGAALDAEFCPVCRGHMDEAFDWVQNPELENPDVPNPDPENPDVTNPDRRPASPTNLRTTKPPPPAPGPGFMSAAFVTQEPAPAPKPVAPAPGTPPPTKTATPPPAASTPIVRLVVSFDPANGAIVAKQAFPITARYVPSYRRLGTYAYEILDESLPDGRQSLEVGVFPSNLFQSRSYQGGGARHQTSDAHATDVVIQIPNATADTLRDPKRAVSIRIYRIAPTVTERLITPAVLARLKSNKLVEPRGSVTSDQLRKVM